MIPTLKYKPHRFSKLVPEPTKAELEELTADIEKNGLRDPAILFEGEILDGRSRQMACHKAGVELRTEEFDPELHGPDPLAFVVSKNFRRRQLQMTASEKAAYVAENILPVFEARAKERIKAGAAAGVAARVASNDARVGGAGAEEVKSVTRKPKKPVKAVEEAAKVTGVSASSIERAKAKAKGEKLTAKQRDEKARTEAFARIEKVLGKDHGFFVGTRLKGQTHGTGPQALRKTPVLVQFSKLDNEKMHKVAGLLLHWPMSLKGAFAFNDRKTITERTTLRDLFYLAAVKGMELEKEVDGWTVEVYRTNRKK
jgi:hypothetical protein